MTVEEIKKRFEGVRYVRWHGRYYHIEHPLFIDRHGRIGLVELRDGSRGVQVDPIDVWPAELHQVKAIDELLNDDTVSKN